MRKNFQTAYQYFNYLIHSKHRKGHGIHSPFVFEFVNRVLYDRYIYPGYAELRNIRNELVSSQEILSVQETGAGSDYFSGQNRKISDLVNRSSISSRFGKLLFRIAAYYKPSAIIELGTSIGMSTLFLAKGAPDARVVTIEGDKEVCEFSRRLFMKLQVNNIQSILGHFDDYLPYLDEKYPGAELVFIDGNHTLEATLRYFEHFVSRMNEGFIIIDDINWSAGMRQAWETIISDSRASVTIDLFYMGIIVIRKSITPGHYKVRF